MIERIKNIRNIGTYENSGNGKIVLKPLTFIYASNTYGKTTFCDIIRSFKMNDVSIINNRRRIGIKDSEKCSVSLTINKQNVEYNGTSWEVPVESDVRKNIEIFDINFVNENIFTNFKIEHKNKECFTTFVLGDRGVELIQTIQRYEDALLQKENDLKEKIANLDKILSPLTYEEIKKVKFVEEFKDIESILISLNEGINSLRIQQKNLLEIKNLPEIEIISIDFTEVKNLIKSVEEICKIKYDLDLTELKIKLDNIKKEYIGLNDQWIKEGVKISKSRCPFCGSDLTDNARVKVFSEYFSEFVINFCDKIEWLKKRVIKEIKDYNISSTLIKINQGWEKILSIYNWDEETKNNFERNLTSITEKAISISKHIEGVKEELEDCLSKKLESLGTTEFCFSKTTVFLSLICEMEINISEINKIISFINKTFSGYQEKLSNTYIINEIQKTQKEFDLNNKVFLRGSYDDLITELLQIEAHISELKLKIKKTKKQMDQEQEDFLNKYFDTIQEIYTHLGGENYKIERETTQRGKKKVYGVKIYFRGKVVDETRYCLSESDRRALALSVFLAKIKINNNASSILVLDDPVTSFDQNRMRSFITILNSLKVKNYCQALILMHYENFFRLITKVTEDKTLIKIIRQKNNHVFEEIQETDDIFKNEYERMLSKIIKFINAETNNISENDVRIYFEQYLHNFYAYEIYCTPTMKTGRLHDFIIELEKQSLIKINQRDDLLLKLKFLNDSSHVFTEYTVEEQRSFVKEAYLALHNI